ncbi:Stk1 family PASTA domain-containing Ser/Thr kinase [Dubosiella muris]|uniref:Stk1 family PASTA domain-containing Ser/Thr kinase n=2 Tax=Dubosiella TaxID=1937008 RepID=A0AC61RCF7_9FIRM|nr:Stk1 family PASTA domain-containing Ser/Thr kinase [Dubosiella muris]TGY67101.1 Stk1 family PASTA domain-containing Ser/Thr kinase [Dubosiella muris]
MIDIVAKRYKIKAVIGQGGMADVYLAFDQILNREVAIKVLRDKLAEDPVTLVRFQREASAASKLSHPNVVDIYDVGESEGCHYIVMEYVRGRTLKQLISQRGALDYHEAIGIMHQLTSAIVTAHAHHIIHRDIKPQNVLVKDDGTVKITDFGIAIANDAVQLTYYNTVMGSAHYLAPETAQGKEPNGQIDIYSLGIVFYELLTGDVPFRGSTPTEIAIKHLREPMPYPRLFNPSIPQSVENIVLKATAKDVEERYERADEMLYDLEHCLETAYRNMPRLVLKHPTMDIIEVEDGHVKVQKKAARKPEVRKKKRHEWITVGMWTAGLAIVCVLAVAIGTVTGAIRFSGFLGYETMPEIVGMTEQEARDALTQAHFSLENVRFENALSDTVEQGRVIRASEKEGSVILSDSPIDVVVSKGLGFLVQDYTGLELASVQQELAAQNVHLDVQIEYQGEPNTNPGVILKQSLLEPGDRIDPDANVPIHFVVSQYPTITIPSTLIGMDVEEAKDYLNSQGIAVLTRKVSGSTLNKVTSTSPPAGSEYTQEGTDSVVTLYY